MKIEFEASPMGKILILAVVGLVLALVGLIADSPPIALAGMTVSVAALLSLWAMRPPCRGQVKWRSTEDGEIEIGTCQSCDRWTIRIRDGFAAHGRGYAAFREAVEELAATHQAYLPHLSVRLRGLLDKLDSSEDGDAERRQREDQEGLESIRP